MRHLTPFALLLALVLGCSKKPASEPDGSGSNAPTPAEATAAQRTKLLAALKGSNLKARQEAVDELAGWVDSDPPTVAALLALLKDKSTAGAGKTMPTQINSVREAAARALLQAGPKGERALKDKGLAALCEGLSDPSPVVREHTVYTIGLLKSLARPLSSDVMKLCTHPNMNVRQAAFDALRTIGITDVTGFVALINNENSDVAQLAAEQIRELSKVPDAAIPALTAALANEDNLIRTAAAAALAKTGAKAAPAAGALAEAVKKTFAAPYNPKQLYDPHTDAKYWEALRKIGEPAALPLADLLSYHHPIVRADAAQTLAKIGPPARAAAAKLKAALKDEYGIVAIEAACALCAIGEGQQEAVDLIKRAMDVPNSVAQKAIEAIPRMGEAGKPLIPIALSKFTSENPFARAGAIQLVSKLDKAEAAKHVPELARLLTDPIAGVRDRTADVLKKLGPVAAPAAAAIGQALTEERNDGVRRRMVEALIALEAGAKPAVPAMLPLVSEATLPVQLRAQLVASLPVADPGSKQVAATLIAATADSEQPVRLAAVEALPHLNPIPDEALAKLVAVAKTDFRLASRIAALRSLATAGPRAKAMRGEVEVIATGAQEDLALWGKVALAAIDGDVTKAAPTVRAGLTDRSPAVRAAAAEALLLLKPAASDLPTLMKLLKDSSANTKAAAARNITRFGPAAKDAVPALIHLLDDGDGDVKLAAIEALAQIGPAAEPAIERLKKLRGDSPIGKAAKKALEKLGWREKKSQEEDEDRRKNG